MLASLAIVVEIPGGWLALLTLGVPVLVYIWARRASQSSTLTESRVLAEKSVDNIKELWDKSDVLKDGIHANAVDIAYLKGVRDGEKKSEKSC